MLCIQNKYTDPYFNLAAEEYVLKNFKDNCFLLYRNKPAIIVGKHQNTLAEINYEYVKEQKIDVIRRLSGGGTVFHDLGNLNFTFIQNVENKENIVDFKKYTKPIIEVLQKLGVDAKFEGRNDIMIKGKKISGNAEHIFKDRVLHHGTLLFSSKIQDLSLALKVNPLTYSDKGVKSVRSRVTNISEHLTEKIDITDFQNEILSSILKSNSNANLYQYSKKDIEQINKLVNDKYSTWKWNFAYSPKYSFEKIVETKFGSLEIQISVEKGCISKIFVLSDIISENQINYIQDSLIGIEHEENLIRKTLQKLFSSKDHYQISVDDFILAIF
ncbi:lipoate--protein ligase [Bacteroidota bacterium]